MTLPTLAILAGGLATRLRPLTESIPKSLVNVAGEPFLAHQLRLAKQQGFSRVVMLTGHLGHMIRDFVGDGSSFGLELEVIEDRTKDSGTGGAIRDAAPALGDTFFSLYGDSYLDIEVEPIWGAFRSALDSLALITVLHNKGAWDSSNIVFKDSRVVSHDKNSSGRPGVEWIDYGLSVFHREAFEFAPKEGSFDLSQLTADLARQGRLAGFEVHNRFYEIGKPDGLRETEAYILASKTGQLLSG